ncbi:MAG: hypothetical protein SVW57_05475 [Thermodesulfobacteriota bacterium]|nr:hypothetical protein [Thermodesulfobacteriota bacterium]
MQAATQVIGKRPEIKGKGGFYLFSSEVKLRLTCGNCQLICHPNSEERRRCHEMLVRSGVVVQNTDGSLEAVSPDVHTHDLLP